MKKRINKSERKFQSAGRLQRSGQKPKDLSVNARQVTFALTSLKVIQCSPVLLDSCITTA